MGEPSRARLDDAEVERLLGAIEELLGRLEQLGGPTAEVGLDAVAALSELYGEALARIVAMLDTAVTPTSDGSTLAALASDELVGHLLVLHGLHPDSVVHRVSKALDDIRPQLGAHGGIDLIDIQDDIAHIRVTTSGCGSDEPLLSSVADVVLAAAPELAGVDPVSSKPQEAAPLISVESLLHRPAVAP